MKKRYTFYMDGQQVGEKDLNKDLGQGDPVTVNSTAYTVVSVTSTGGNDFDVEVKAAE